MHCFSQGHKRKRNKMNKITKYKKQFFFTLVLCLSAVALYGVIPVSYNTFLKIGTCPMLGVVPACYVVTIGYSLIILSLFLKNSTIFLIGSLPVFILAFFGSSYELMGQKTCPRNAVGTPLCYYSLAVIIVVIFAFYLWRKASRA